MDSNKKLGTIALEQDMLIELPDFLSDVSSDTGIHQNIKCGISQTGCGPQCGTALCGSTQCGTSQCVNTLCGVFQLPCIGCEGASCQSCQCSTQNNQGSPPSSSGTITINPSDITDTAITVHLSSIPGATWYNIVWKIKDGPGLDQEVRNGLSYTFTGLTPEKTYIFNYYGKNNYGSGPYAASVSATTLKKKPMVEPWSWNASNGVDGSAGTASAAKTQAAYRAILNEGCGEDFSYKVWNDLVSKINEVVLAIGALWADTYATLNNTKISGTGQELTAAKYNAAKQNVGSHYSTGIPEVNGNTEFTWSYIDKLVAKLNDWIASL